jgi:hypothetical protein
MKERLFIGIYWNARKQHIDDCANQASQFLVKLHDFDQSSFSSWFGKGWSKEEALQKVIDITDIVQVKNFLLERTKEDEKEFSKIGYLASFWNGKDGLEGMSISFSVGSYSEFLTNNCLINFPFTGSTFETYKNKRNMYALGQFLIDFWEPNWIRINDKKMTIDEFNRLQK